MKKIILLTVFIIGTMLALSSCGKKGCTDSQAVNYCEKCKKDDQSCKYEGHAVAWWGKQVSDSLQAYGVTAIKVYVDGTFIDSKAASTYWNSAPAYGSGISAKKDLGSSKTAAGTMEMKDQNGTSIATANFTWDKAADHQEEFAW